MLNLIRNFVREDQGQDIIEYTLLLGFVALASAALFIQAGTAISGIWGAASNSLSYASTKAS
jgi:Flp pilus assembly pilin Flp